MVHARFKQFLVINVDETYGPKHPRSPDSGFLWRFIGNTCHETTTGFFGHFFVAYILPKPNVPANCTKLNVEKCWLLKPTELWRVFHRMLPTENVRRLGGFSTFSLLHVVIFLLSWCFAHLDKPASAWSGQLIERFHNSGRWTFIKVF